jgi:hypothetical protein
MSDQKHSDTSARLVLTITEYLSVGGLFNPEFMEHDKVRDLLIACRDELQRIHKLEKALALLNSMVLSGEGHSDTSRQTFNEALASK